MKKNMIIVILSLSIVGLLLLSEMNWFSDNTLIWFLIALACMSCFALYKYGNEALEIASIPSLVCIFSGLLPLYGFIHGEQYSFSDMADKFCYFICGIWFLYSDIKINGKKEQ